ncbi:MAG: staygreen family protein [Candidatus Thorarchaeota archaeon]
MKRLNPQQLHVRFIQPTQNDGPINPRTYTLTHSDSTGELFLTIGPHYNRKQISGWYTRLMRDEVLAEWREGQETYELHVHCEVERGIGWTSMRESIFRRELDLVLEAFRYGDRGLYVKTPGLNDSRVIVHLHMKKKQNDRVEDWGRIGNYI